MLDSSCVEDIAPQVSTALSIGPKAFRRFRREHCGDGTITYSADMSKEGTVDVSPRAYKKMIEMIEVVAYDNLERPFFVLIECIENENGSSQSRAVDVVVGRPGDEGSCTHDDYLVQLAQQKVNDLKCSTGNNIKLSVGHTHPVFYPESNTLNGLGKKPKGSKYGALPSDCYGDRASWEKRLESSDSLEQKKVIEEIISRKLYKRYCEDYIESYMSTYRDGFLGASQEERCHKLHWIITPRLKQIGVFEVPCDDALFGHIIYHSWSTDTSETS